VQQFNNIKHFKPDVDDILQLVLVPCNHFLIGVRFDVSDEDPNMDGALVRIAGQRVAVDPTNPDSYLISELPDFDDAAAAQGLGDIPLDVPGSYVLWLAKLSNGGATGDAPAGGGPITSGGATGYFQPLYVPPETINYAGKTKHYMTGGLYLGLKVVHQPTDVAYTIGDMTNTCYMGAHIFGFEFKHGV
jgi:hypothetical protein